MVRQRQATLVSILSVSRDPVPRQRSEQYLTCSQSRSHFFRQLKGRAQQAHILVGSSDFLRIFM